MTEPTPIDLPAGLRWVKLVCRLGRLVTDSAADADAHPDLLPVGGTLTLTASPSRVRIQEADGRWRSVEVAGRTYTIRADGELVDNEGRVGVYIPDPASLLVEPQGYAITAVVKPTGGADWRVTVGGDTVLPDVVDLVAVSSVGSASPSVTASFDARLYALETGGGVDVGQAVEDYLVANPPAGGGTVHYGADAATPRPVSSQPVIWVGRAGVTPTGAVDYDIVINYEWSETEPPPAPPTAAPTLTVAATSGSSIDGTISPLADATGYEWAHEPGTVAGAPSAAAVDIGASLSFSAVGLDAATTYTFWARGYNEDGPGPWSEPRTATTAAGSLLEFVEDFNITPANQRLASDPRWAIHISAHVLVHNDDPTYGNYATNTSSSGLRGAKVDPAEVPFPPDQWVEADVAFLSPSGTGARVIVYARATGNEDYYYGYIDDDGAWKLASTVADVATDLATGSIALPEFPYTLRLEAEGSQITLLVNGTELATVANSDHATGQPALGFYRSGHVVPEFRAGELP